MLTCAPSVWWLFMHHLVSLCAMDDNLNICTHDVSQAYVQSGTAVQYQIYVCTPVELKLFRWNTLSCRSTALWTSLGWCVLLRAYHNHQHDVVDLHPS